MLIEYQETAATKGANRGGVPACRDEAKNPAGGACNLNDGHCVSVGAGDIQVVFVGAQRKGTWRHAHWLSRRKRHIYLFLDAPCATLFFEHVDEVCIGTGYG